MRVRFFRSPPVPRAVPPCWLAARGRAEEGGCGRGDRRAAAPGPGVRHRYRQSRDGRDDPGAAGRDPARRAAETRTFGTTRREVLALADWLRSWQVPAVVM